jgi:hypothetical protein
MSCFSNGSKASLHAFRAWSQECQEKMAAASCDDEEAFRKANSDRASGEESTQLKLAHGFTNFS